MPGPHVSIQKKIALKVETVYRKIHRLIAWLTGYLKHPMTCDVYHAIEHEDGISVKGRVVRMRKIREPDPDDSAIRNLFEMWKNWVTPKRPNTEVIVRMGEGKQVVRSDRGGYFETEIEGTCGSDPVVLDIPVSNDSEAVEMNPLSYSPTEAEYLLISDIDDTILVTDAARTLRMIATTLFGNALTRQIFPGSAPLYQGLKKGTALNGGSHINPICYVTSSPYNLHSLVSLIFQTNGIPGGAFLMASWGLDETKWFRHNHVDHKLDAIQTALSWYPSLPAILIGDSGEHDTDIYAEVARSHPGRIVDVLIRNVSSDSKIEHLQKRWEDSHSGDNFFIFKDCLQAARRLHERGRISGEVVDAVSESIESEENILKTLIEHSQKSHRRK